MGKKLSFQWLLYKIFNVVILTALAGLMVWATYMFFKEGVEGSKDVLVTILFYIVFSCVVFKCVLSLIFLEKLHQNEKLNTARKVAFFIVYAVQAFFAFCLIASAYSLYSFMKIKESNRVFTVSRQEKITIAILLVAFVISLYLLVFDIILIVKIGRNHRSHLVKQIEGIASA